MKRIEKDKFGKPLSASYEDYLIESLKDPKEAKEYLNAALEDGDYRVFLLALLDVAKAYGITEVASKAQLNRVNIYRMLSEKGNPETSSLVALLNVVGVRLKIELAKPETKEEHYEFELEKAGTENVVPKYAKPNLQKVKDFPKSSSIYRPRAVSCEYQLAA